MKRYFLFHDLCSMNAKADLTMQEQKRRQRRTKPEEMHDMTQMSEPMTS